MADVLTNSSILAHTILREKDAYDNTLDPIVLESIIDHLKQLYRHLLVIPQIDDNLLSYVSLTIATIEEKSENVNRETSRRVVPLLSGNVRFDIAQDQIEYLLDLSFTCPDIARLLGVSLRTIRRRMEEFGICLRDRYSCISDAELDEELVSIKQSYPNAGIKTVSGKVTFACF